MSKFYVTEDVAEKLRAKGYYREYDVTDDWVEGIFYQVEDGTFHLPRIDEVLAWLREEKKRHLLISTYHHTPFNVHDWGYDIINLRTYNVEHYDYGYNSYEESTLAGISYVLDNLI